MRPTLGHVAGKLRLTDRAAMPVDLFHTVRGSLAGHVVPHHHAGRTTTFAGADDVETLDLGEEIDVQLLADRETFDRNAEFANEALRFAIGLGGGLDTSLGAAAGPLAVEFGNLTTLSRDWLRARRLIK